MSQEMFQNFESMFSMFWVFFGIVFALGIGFTILFFWRMIRAGRTFDPDGLWSAACSAGGKGKGDHP
jgi:hypothetical protein